MKKILGLAAIMSSFAFVACGDDTGTGGAGTTGSTVTATGSTKTTSASNSASAGSTKSTSANSSSANGSSSTGGGMSFTLSLTGWPHVGNKHEAAVVVGGTVIQKVTATGAATTTFDFTGIPAGAAKLHYYADVNDDMGCNAPPTDHVWEQDITVDGQDKEFAHDANWTDVCASFQ